MGRKADPARREQLLVATAAYLEDNGLAGLSLRPLASALGVSPRTLLYHFGSKEQLLTDALNASPGLKAALAEFVVSDEPLFTRVRRLWARTTDPSSRPYLRLFFEVYAAALRDPQRYAAFLSGVVDGWLALLTPMLEHEGVAPARAGTVATELLALHHGCALDLLATGDHGRVDAAYRSRLAELETALARQSR
jgi:AcrR family transcriptional regulator